MFLLSLCVINKEIYFSGIPGLVEISLSRLILAETPYFGISANSFRTCMYCDQRSQYIRLKSKKNSFRGNTVCKKVGWFQVNGTYTRFRKRWPTVHNLFFH